MPDIYPDSQGNRVIVRHKGPAGAGVPTGGLARQMLVKHTDADQDTEWVTPPTGTDAISFTGTIPASGEIAIFDGITGKLIKASGKSLSYYAAASALVLKQDAVTGKGLSTNDYTTVEKTKLGQMALGGFRGAFASLVAINATTFSNPTPQPGDYCLIENVGTLPQLVLRDSTNSVWVLQMQEAVDMTGEQIAAVLFDSEDPWSFSTCQIFTSLEKAQLANHEATLNAFLTGSSSFQVGDALLTSLSNLPVLSNVGNKLPYLSDTDTVATVDFTSAGRSVVSATSFDGIRTLLGLGTTDPVQFQRITLPSGGTAPGTAPLKLTSQVLPLSSEEQGTFELIGNSLQFTQLVKRRGITMSQGTLIADVVCNNTTVKTDPIIEAFHEANYLEVGKTEELTLRGTVSQRTGASAFGSFYIKYAGLTIQMIKTPALTAIPAGSPFELRVSVTVRSVGSSGSAHVHAMLFISGISINDFGAVGLATINTTVAQNTSIGFQWNEANALNLMTVNQGRVLCIEPNR